MRRELPPITRYNVLQPSMFEVSARPPNCSKMNDEVSNKLREEPTMNKSTSGNAASSQSGQTRTQRLDPAQLQITTACSCTETPNSSRSVVYTEKPKNASPR